MKKVFAFILVTMFVAASAERSNHIQIKDTLAARQAVNRNPGKKFAAKAIINRNPGKRVAVRAAVNRIPGKRIASKQAVNRIPTKRIASDIV